VFQTARRQDAHTLALFPRGEALEPRRPVITHENARRTGLIAVRALSLINVADGETDRLPPRDGSGTPHGG
jgi:hypothetical protein